MKIAVLGTGSVGQTLAAKCADLGHHVVIGTRDPERLSDEFALFLDSHSAVKALNFSGAVSFGDLVINAVSGAHTLEALQLAGAENLSDKVLIDVANPLDFSKGMPPTLSVCNESSLAEEIQLAFPNVRVIKSLNTMTASLMVKPSLLDGDHQVFINGNSAAAKEVVQALLQEFGWKASNIVDLGDITASRGVEMYLPLWLRIYGAMGTALLNVRIVR
jgi:predicted dinucleotide-binding enzyme